MLTSIFDLSEQTGTKIHILLTVALYFGLSEHGVLPFPRYFLLLDKRKALVALGDLVTGLQVIGQFHRFVFGS